MLSCEGVGANGSEEGETRRDGRGHRGSRSVPPERSVSQSVEDFQHLPTDNRAGFGFSHWSVAEHTDAVAVSSSTNRLA